MSKEALCVAAATQQSDVDLGEAERGLLGHDEDVAGGGNRQTRAECRAVERTDDGLGAFADRVEALADAAIVLPTLPCCFEPRAPPSCPRRPRRPCPRR